MNKVKLIRVTPNNNNKFYNMEDLGNNTFKVEYGRVGATSIVLTYPIHGWYKKYNEKLKRGYIDIPESLQQDIKKAQLKIDNKDVKDLISFLMSCAKQSIKSNYEVSLDNISDIQINKAQELLDWLNNSIQAKTPANIINDKLKSIYITISRKMSDTRSFFVKKNDYKILELLELLQAEQNRLNTLKSQVNLNQKSKTVEDITLDTLGFKCELASQEDRDLITKETDFKIKNQRIFKITNPETEKTFNPNHLKTKLLYHGSRNENFLSILQTGLKIRQQV